MSSTITTLTEQTRATSSLKSSQPKTTVAVCTWKGHCLGDSCSSEDDCDRDWVCANKTCRTCCLTDNETTFFSTFSPSSDLTTTTSSSRLTSSSATPTPTSSALIATSAPTQASSGGLKTGAAVGIGVGGAVLLIICIAGGFWFFLRRRKGHETHELSAVSPDDDRKELYRATAQAHELPTRHPPAELSAIELVELQDSDVGRQRHDDKATT